MPGSVIVSSARTPIGQLSGALSSFEATDLGGHAIRAALARAGVSPRAGRLRLRRSGDPGRLRPDAGAPGRGEGRHPHVGAVDDLNKACLSGIDAIYLADLMIQAGDADVVVAGGMESMTRAPYLLQNAREGYRMGNGELARLDARRRPVLRLRRHPHGREHRALHRRARRDHARHEGRPRGEEPRTRRRRRRRRAASPRRSSRSRSPSARATRSWSTPTKASGPAPPSESLAGLRPAFDGTAPSPPATRRRSPTVPPRSWSCRRPRPRSSGSSRSPSS